MKFQIHYPTKPYRITQRWGIYRPEIYSQFGFTRHNGEDFALGYEAKLYSIFDGVVVKKGYQPSGGGIFVGIISKHEYEFDDGIKCRVLADYLHCKEILVNEGQNVETGELIAIADNTGFSTGNHTHLQLRRVNWDGKVITIIDKNDANNSFDPSPYWSGLYAEDIRRIQGILEELKERVAKLAIQVSNYLLKKKNPNL